MFVFTIKYNANSRRMLMDKQFRLYSVDTKSFYTECEIELNKKQMNIKNKMKWYEEWEEYNIIHNSEIDFRKYKYNTKRFKGLKRKKNKTANDEVEINELKEFFKAPKKIKNKNIKKEYITYQEQKKINDRIKIKMDKKIKENLNTNEDYIKLRKKLNKINKKFSNVLKNSSERKLNPKSLTPYKQIALFENSLSRAMGINENELITSMMLVRVYHYTVLKQLIKHGFTYTDEYGEVHTYRFFTASAGQIRTKKALFIDTKVWEEYEKTLMCGLTINDINKSNEKGCNINKFLAYLALCNSATDEWKDFDIDRAIVIDDFETMVEGEVDYIDNKTFKITRQTMDIPIPHSDGCGWILPSISSKNFMTRLPWVKGLLTPCPYMDFLDIHKKHVPISERYKIKDIYGKEWDLRLDRINVIFSKSQFKMYKYYKSWEQYQEWFKEFNCKANKCNIEPDTKEFRKASFNYQMWQTLTDVTDKEIEEFTKPVDEFITKGYSDRDTMIKILGADKNNLKKTYLQKCIAIYPEMIQDYHIKEELASTLNKRKKEAKFGKFKIDATYTFLLPDVFAWMQYVFLEDEKPSGLLNNGEVSCRLYKKTNELLVDRSPHLYREHAVRDNVNNSETKKWFITDGIYTSSHDLISKILQFDVDGDKGLVISQNNLIKVAKRNMEGIVPLYYEMGKAKAINIDEDNIYESLTKAFKYNNIGKFSNKLTVVWNSGEIDERKMNILKFLTADLNFTIDSAKTLVAPQIPKEIEEEMKESNGKMPYFFQFAKDKDKEEVSEINDSTVNRICKKIENIKQQDYDFSTLGKFKKSYLMNNSKIEINNSIIDKYKELDKEKQMMFVDKKKQGMKKEEIYLTVFKDIRIEFESFCNASNIDIVDAIDMIIKYIYSTNKNKLKGFLFDIFGDIIYNNLKNNIKQPLGKYKMCEVCGKRFEITNIKNTSQIYCKKCSKEKEKSKTLERVCKFRNKL